VVAAAAHLAVALGHRSSRPPVAPVGEGARSRRRLDPAHPTAARRPATSGDGHTGAVARRDARGHRQSRHEGSGCAAGVH
jgi:hypothetical protein